MIIQSSDARFPERSDQALLIAGLVLYIIGLTAPLATVTVVENRWLSAIMRTIGLTKGFRWPIIGTILLFGLSSILISIPMTLIAGLASSIGTVGVVIGLVVYLLGSVIIYGATFAVVTLIYLRLREIKEGTSADNLAEIFS